MYYAFFHLPCRHKSEPRLHPNGQRHEVVALGRYRRLITLKGNVRVSWSQHKFLSQADDLWFNPPIRTL